MRKVPSRPPRISAPPRYLAVPIATPTDPVPRVVEVQQGESRTDGVPRFFCARPCAPKHREIVARGEGVSRVQAHPHPGAADNFAKKVEHRAIVDEDLGRLAPEFPSGLEVFRTPPEFGRWRAILFGLAGMAQILTAGGAVRDIISRTLEYRKELTAWRSKAK